MSKENVVLELFFQEPSKQWHFEEILTSAQISRPQATQWLKRFRSLGLIKRVKPRGAMPYSIANFENSVYQTKKRLYALNQLEERGFLSHLASLVGAQTVILFGSLSRWDWHKDSDIDIFIYGDAKDFDKQQFRKKLHREIETFICKDTTALSTMNPALLRNIAEGYLIKGDLKFLEYIYA